MYQSYPWILNIWFGRKGHRIRGFLYQCITECMICPKNDVLLFLARYCPQSMYGIWSVGHGGLIGWINFNSQAQYNIDNTNCYLCPDLSFK